ncbi:MAG TPA: hypothetical protein VJP45_00460 [Candidatus Limnocylindria bacterium]|nr:hypothetical protein [Candidatus Limnocylindria bacterium]
MSVSDFPKSAARISEGFCPLCDGRMNADAFCVSCEVGWTLEGSGARKADEDVQVFGTAGVLIVPSRRLRPDEIKRLYARPALPP